jgi:hypothetical protein
VYIGVLASDTMNGIKEENNPDIPLFYSQCREFFIEAVKQIQARFVDCNKLDIMSCLSPTIAFNLKMSSLIGLYQKMPFVAQVADLQKVDQEWREHSLVSSQNVPRLKHPWLCAVKSSPGQNVPRPKTPNLCVQINCKECNVSL